MTRPMEVDDLCQIRYRKYWWKVLGFADDGVVVESQGYRPKRDVVNPHEIVTVIPHG